MPTRPSLAALRRIALGPGLLVAAVAAGLALGGRAAGGWVMDRVVGAKFDDVPQIDTTTAAARLAGPTPPLLLDVRSAEEYAVSHLPGARRLAPDADPTAALADVPPDRPIVLYCSVGWRSAEMARRMRRAGFEQVTNMQGSIFRWVAEGRPLVDAEGAAVARVHPFGAPWSWLVAPDDRAAAP